MTEPGIVVLAGGTSPEREVSLGSGLACAVALARLYRTRMLRVEQDALPAGLDPEHEIVFSTLHGTFGEDGGMQRLLDAAGVSYAGCDSASSALTMDKQRTKDLVAAHGITVIPGFEFVAGKDAPSAETVEATVGADLVLKPNDQGSSVGLQLLAGRAEITRALEGLKPGSWLAERRIRGRELSVGVVGDRALGVVEIRPRSGVYDYYSKYTRGVTEYLAPSPLDEGRTAEARAAAETAFRASGCRDYARVDFILGDDGALYFLEINTLPGMKETSLLPMSARCAGMDFTALVRELVEPARRRFSSVALSP